MGVPPPLDRVVDGPRRLGRSTLRRFLHILLTGTVIILPFVVLLVLFEMALGLVRQGLNPLIQLLAWTGLTNQANVGFLGDLFLRLGLYQEAVVVFGELLAVLVLFGAVMVVGVVASFRSGERLVEHVDAGIARVPGIGPVYRSLREMGDIVVNDGLDNFESVKLVEFPQEGLYTLAFETNRAPDSVAAAVGEADMVTLFVPFAPNPVMGGFLVHVGRESVYDVEMSVEEAARALVTSGLAEGDADRPGRQRDGSFQRAAPHDGGRVDGEGDGG